MVREVKGRQDIVPITCAYVNLKSVVGVNLHIRLHINKISNFESVLEPNLPVISKTLM